MDMYFDAVIVPDNSFMNPIFNGTTEETVKWLKDNPSFKHREHSLVCVGKTLECMSIYQYLLTFG
jgi:hypothetical protein